MNSTAWRLKAKLPTYVMLTLVLSGGAVASGQVKPPEPKDLDPEHAAKMAKGLDLFKKHIKPLIESKCLRCHGGQKIESEFDLSDRDSLVKGGLHGPAVVPGKSKDSLLIKLVHHHKDPFMPRNGAKLPAEALAQLAAWIDLGAPYDNPLVASKAKKRSWTEKVIDPESRQWWAFQPLAKATPPKVANASLVKTPLDRFLLEKLDAAGIAPNPPAPRHVLIRRAYFDLLGLPPPPEEVEAFLQDTAPDAWPKLIDRLLQSPHYGERWGRHWLDLARFAESHGFEHDYDRPTAYHYRDFVIEALNRDLPYDTFVKWQIAGDEYAPHDNLALKATGFLAAGVHSTQITKSEVEKHRYDEMDDKLNTLSTAMLGLTVGCARCHDHKYDPIPQRDYYQLLATFTTTIRSEMELNVDPQGYQKAKNDFDRAHAPFIEALRAFEIKELPGRFAAWEKTGASAQSFPWEIMSLREIKSKEGATLTMQSDGSVLASGKNGKFDVYTFVAHSQLKNITAIRLEALAHPSMVKGGPGRAGNGNFALSDFKVTATPLTIKNAKPITLQLRNPRGTFEQKGLPIRAAIDGDPKSAWAIDPQFGKDHAAVFELAESIGFDGGTALTFTLSFNNNDGHNLGRPRLSLTNAVGPQNLVAPGIAAATRELLAGDRRNRTPEQSAQLLQWYRTLDPQWTKLHQDEQAHLAKAPRPQLVKALVASEGLPPIRLHSQGEDFLNETHFLRRGDPDNKERVATQGFLQVLMPEPEAARRWQTPPPKGWRTSYRRRALAEWLTDVDHGAGALLARVMANRLWQHHFGRGLVATPSDYGVRGEKPTHPELLDWLARQLLDNGWKLKPMHKLMMTSAAYMQSSTLDEAKAKVDRDNKLVWRFPPRRLEAEVIRDAILAVGGQLDPKMYGPGTLDEASKRRSIYFTVKRSKLVPMMIIFDAPEALNGMAERPTTTIAPQALHLMNNPRMRDCAKTFAGRLGTGRLPDAVRTAYHIALARDPSADEVADAMAFLNLQMQTYAADQRRERALTDFCQVLLCLNEFVYVD